jgi:CRISPR-associated protein Cas2
MSHSAKAEATLYAFCYDFSNDKERRQIDKLLSGYGFRVQWSVFECHLTVAQRRALFHKLSNMSLRSGHIRVYQVYAEGHATTFGQAPKGKDNDFAYVV